LYLVQVNKITNKAGENMIEINNFAKEKEFLICIDSDGSAIDTMTEKHQKAFGPEAVKVWGLESVKDIFLKKWDKVNLYSNTRGINRFKGLVKTFNALKVEGHDLPEITKIQQWVETSSELSNPALKREIEKSKNKEELKLALQWSQQVNQKISELEKDIKKVFKGVKESLIKISFKADIAVVSSANQEALLDEWESYNLQEHVKIILGQEAGSKADNIKDLKQKGYKTKNILMIGDAPGDLRAAETNDVSFYPIIPTEEEQSWSVFLEQTAAQFFAGNYREKYEDKLIKKFKFILK
jgi:phosphoglycolate phosphatase-like HAD superfamily hydrolase